MTKAIDRDYFVDIVFYREIWYGKILGLDRSNFYEIVLVEAEEKFGTRFAWKIWTNSRPAVQNDEHLECFKWIKSIIGDYTLNLQPRKNFKFLLSWRKNRRNVSHFDKHCWLFYKNFKLYDATFNIIPYQSRTRKLVKTLPSAFSVPLPLSLSLSL